MRQIGTRDHPVRMSATGKILECPMSYYLQAVGAVEDTSGKAAQTGSACHEMIQRLHSGGDPATVEQDCADKFPLADWREAERHFADYQSDPENTSAQITHIEQKVSLVIDDVYFSGTLDQLRLAPDGRYYVWDVKTGRSTGQAMCDIYACQMAGYTLAARQSLGLDVYPGGFIRTLSYRKGENAHIQFPLSLAQCNLLLDQVVRSVQRMRQGEVEARPAFRCRSICPLRGVDNCLHLHSTLEN